MLSALEGKVEKVVVSARLTDEPVCLVAEGPISLEMEKTLAGSPDGEAFKSQRVLEVNAKHSVFASLQAAQAAEDTDKISRYAKLLYDQALLMEGMPLEDPVAFAQEVSNLMK
jgi:molecular chaperone HtpG